MTFISTFISILEVIIVFIPILLSVAFITVAERKVMASMQRRLGPNVVGYYGLLQAFADALKLILKEYVSPTQANLVLFFLGPVITLIFSLLGYLVIPFAPSISIFDFNLGILFLLAVSSLATYGILLAGWSANSKYAFLGSLRSTAQLISYELVLSSVIFLVILLTSNLSLTVTIEAQKSVWFIAPLFPAFLIFFIGSIAETNRAPFDLAEAESELVSGFMTEHSAVVFVFFFLAEYASIVLMCILITILFAGGYLINFKSFILVTEIVNTLINYVTIYYEYIIHNIYIYIDTIRNDFNILDITNYYYNISDTEVTNITDFSKEEITSSIITINNTWFEHISLLHNDKINIESIIQDSNAESLTYGLTMAIKSFIMTFIFIWVRASQPRIRYDQLMSYCWTVLLPIVFAFIVILPCLLFTLDIMPNNVLFF